MGTFIISTGTYIEINLCVYIYLYLDTYIYIYIYTSKPPCEKVGTFHHLIHLKFGWIPCRIEPSTWTTWSAAGATSGSDRTIERLGSRQMTKSSTWSPPQWITGGSLVIRKNLKESTVKHFWLDILGMTTVLVGKIINLNFLFSLHLFVCW